MGKAPDPTPPKETSAAATGTNVSTAIANSFLNNPNEVTADGTKTTEQTGSYAWTDPYTGQTYNVPRFTTTQTLSAGQQAIKDQQDAAKLGLATLGNQQTSFLKDYMNKPVDLSNEATEARLFELGSKRLDPKFAQLDESLRTRLANQGIKAGSEAYDREIANFQQGRNDAYNQLALNGRGQAVQEALTQRNQPINEITALLSGGQVSQPQFMTGFNGANIPTTDNAAVIGNYDQAKLAQWQQNQAMLGGLFSGLGSIFSLSDARAKDDIEPIGKTKDGLGIYSYRYKGDPETRIGLMAQEVAAKKPEAIAFGRDGLMRVDYAAALRKQKEAA